MEWLVVPVCVCLFGLVLWVALRSSDKPRALLDDSGPSKDEIVTLGDIRTRRAEVATDGREVDDELFKAFVDGLVAKSNADWFYAKVVGVTFLNDDGGSRQTLVRRLRTRDVLTLEPDPTNPYDPRAIRVLNDEGMQIGFLNRRTAAELSRAMKRGVEAFAIVAHLNHSPDGKRAGVSIAILRFYGSKEA